jgi:S1-C subfamily serine protease
VPKVGEPILARGNPGSIEFIEVRGFVAGKMRKVGDAWLEGVITDISFTGGISGGPVYDAGGNVVGVAVGVMAAPTGSGRDGYGTGVAVIVPASTVCMLLGREVEVG